ncbi:STAS domain-containing protein [Streptomyces diastatochromogenes]|uniref:STAS domain-containing protein n=1 Tax=Streptomyces diastatochromogenes TaxID=42236 RepID=UPI0036BCF521
MEPIVDGCLSILYEHVSASVTVVTLAGELDGYTCSTLREVLVGLINDGHFLLAIDMRELDFIGSPGSGVLVGALKRLRAHDGHLALSGVQPQVRKHFRITRLDRIFPIHPTALEAEESLSAPALDHRTARTAAPAR